MVCIQVDTVSIAGKFLTQYTTILASVSPHWSSLQRLCSMPLENHEEQVTMPATLMGAVRQSFAYLRPSNTQLMSFSNRWFLQGYRISGSSEPRPGD